MACCQENKIIQLQVETKLLLDLVRAAAPAQGFHAMLQSDLQTGVQELKVDKRNVFCQPKRGGQLGPLFLK